MDLNHLHLAVKDVTKSKDFYSAFFGFTEKLYHGPILFLTNASGFELALDPKFSPSELPIWYHHGFRLPNRNDVTTLFDRMNADSPSSIEKTVHDHGDHVWFRCKDVDGYRIEVYWEPTL